MCNGRTVIYDSHTEVTRENILEILKEALPIFATNQQQVRYLENYRKGIQPILNREKTIRPEICNKVVVNRASEISAFKVGYLLTKPVQYVSRSKDIKIADKIIELNDLMYESDKEFYDKTLAERFSVSGTAYRLVLPTNRGEDCPFKINELRSDEAFVVYYSGTGKEPLLGVIEVIFRDINNEQKIKYCCYSKDMYYEIVDGMIVAERPHFLKSIPVIEYPNNTSRIGDFEIVIPLLDAINLVYSNRIDGVEQFVQSLMKFINVDISEEDFQKLKDLGAIKLKSSGDGTKQDVEFITQEMSQDQIQVLINSLYQDVLTICGMPNRNGGYSTSDTGSAVIMRDGWEAAESRARGTELMFKRSDKKFLKIVLLILNVFKFSDLKLKDIDIKFTRRNYENINQKATVLTTMLGCDKIHPKLAFESCGLFTDPEVAYIVSKNYTEKMQQMAQTIREKETDSNPNLNLEKGKDNEDTTK